MAPWMALFPPGKGGGESVARRGKGKGILIHSLTEGNGMPLANRTTPANGDARTQVLPFLEAVKVRTGHRGRPRKRLKVIATAKGSDAKALRQQSDTPGRAGGLMSRTASKAVGCCEGAKIALRRRHPLGHGCRRGLAPAQNQLGRPHSPVPKNVLPRSCALVPQTAGRWRSHSCL
jgi:hypothetical protein